MLDDTVIGHEGASLPIQGALIRVELGIGLHMGGDDVQNGPLIGLFDVEHLGFALAFHQGDNRTLAGMRRPAALRALLDVVFRAKIGLIHFDAFAFAANRGRGGVHHGFTDTVFHEPGGAVGAEAKHPVKLVGRNALLASANQMRGQQPLMQGNMRPLIDGAHRCGERLAAIAALPDTRAGAFALQFDGIAYNPTVWAYRTIWPADRLEVLPGGFFVVIDRVCEIVCHAEFIANSGMVRQVHNDEYIPK